MKQILPLLLIVALAGCSGIGPVFNRSGGNEAPQAEPETPEDATEGEEENAEGEEGAEGADASEDGAAEAPAPTEDAPESEGDPFDAPETPASEPAAPASEGSSTPEPAADGRLGTTTASLGDPNEAGFWLKTPLVSAPQPGRVVYVATGRSVQVQLIPSGTPGGGSQISIAAMRLLEAPLTGLPELVVYAN